MKLRIAVVLLLIAFVLALLTPAEERLGNSYKLIYAHLPLSIISFVSLFLFPFLTYFDRNPQNFAVATLIFILAFFIFTLKISRQTAIVYSIIQPVLAYWVYQGISEAPFQLHPVSLVEMDITMKLPLFFTFPAFAIIYYCVGTLKRA